jgi:hypothetical protein
MALANESEIESLSVPADGTSAATEGNGDFGTSPFYEQLSDKPHQLALCIFMWGTGTPSAREN